MHDLFKKKVENIFENSNNWFSKLVLLHFEPLLYEKSPIIPKVFGNVSLVPFTFDWVEEGLGKYGLSDISKIFFNKPSKTAQPKFCP